MAFIMAVQADYHKSQYYLTFITSVRFFWFYRHQFLEIYPNKIRIFYCALWVVCIWVLDELGGRMWHHILHFVTLLFFSLKGLWSNYLHGYRTFFFTCHCHCVTSLDSKVWWLTAVYFPSLRIWGRKEQLQHQSLLRTNDKSTSWWHMFYVQKARWRPVTDLAQLQREKET